MLQAKDVIEWQNQMMDHIDERGKKYSPVYLKTLHNQLSAVFNHAVRYYELPYNPAAKAGVKRIRIHDLRHSHVSLLIDMGYSAVAIGERVGHESADITYHYAHLFPSVQTDMANDLNNIKLGGDADVSEKP